MRKNSFFFFILQTHKKYKQESMGAGWYKDVEAAQGQQGTFWAGSVM